MKTLLLTDGPPTTTDAARAAPGHDRGSRDTAFAALMARPCGRPRAPVRGTDAHGTVPIAGRGTFAVEAAVGTLVLREGKLLVLANSKTDAGNSRTT